MPSSTHDSAYTPLEHLLLFHNVEILGPQTSTFTKISNTLLKHPVVCADDTFDRGRLSPDALREQYTWLLSKCNVTGGKTGDMESIREATARMYEEYKKVVFKEIRDEERRFVQLQKEIKDIQDGKWDERLVKEWERTRARSRSVSSAPLRAATGSPALEGKAAAGSPAPQKVGVQKMEEGGTNEAPAGHVNPAQTGTAEKVESTPELPQAVPQLIPDHPQQLREITIAEVANGVAPVVRSSASPPVQLSTAPAHPSAGPASQSPQIPIPSPQVLRPHVPTPLPPFQNVPILAPQHSPAGHVSPSPTLPSTPMHHGPIPGQHGQQLSPHRPVANSPGPLPRQVQMQHSPVRHQALPSPSGWQQQQMLRASPSSSQISPPLPIPQMHPHYSPGPHPQSPMAQIPVSAHGYNPISQPGVRGPATPVGGYFPHPQPAQAGSPVLQHHQQQMARSPGAPFSPSPYGILQQPLPHTQAPFQHSPALQPGPSTPLQASPRRPRPPPLAINQPFTPVPAGYIPPNPGSPRQPGPEDISPISTPPSSPRPGKTPSPVSAQAGAERSKAYKRPLEESSDEKKATATTEKRPPVKRQRSMKLPNSAESSPANVSDRSQAAEPLANPVGEASTPTPGRGRGRGRGGLRSTPIRGRARGRGTGTPMATRSEGGVTGSAATSAPTSPEKMDTARSSKGASTEPENTASPPSTATRRPAASDLVPSTPSSQRKRKKPLIDYDSTDDELPAFEQGARDSPRKSAVQQNGGDSRHQHPRPEPTVTTSGSSIGGASPAATNPPLLVAVGQQPMVVATKKFSTLTTPLIGNILSHKFANLFSAPVVESRAPGYKNLIYKPQDMKSIKAAIRAGTLSLQSLDPSSSTAATPTRATPPTFPAFPASALPASSTATSITMPATTLNTPPRGIVNSLQLEKELFRMFANAVMYNKTNTEIVKETNIMAKDVEAMVNNFRGAEEVGTRKALAAKEKEVGGAATWGGRRNLFQREETGEKEKDRARTESVAGDAMEKGGSERGGGSGVGGGVGGSGGRSMEEDAEQQEEEEEEEGESGKEEEDNEDDAKSADGTLTEEHVQVPKKRGRPKRRKEEEMEED